MEVKNIELKIAKDSKIIENLFQYYIYDMSEYAGFSPNPDGTYSVPDSVTGLSNYWKLPNHFPYYIYANGELAGFSLIRNYPGREKFFDIGQFYVLRKFKGQGVGKKAFELSVKKHPGEWITRVLPNNTGAFKFWTKAINSISETSSQIVRELYNNKEMDFFYYSVK